MKKKYYVGLRVRGYSEWAKHLRPIGKRFANKRTRKSAKLEVRKEAP